MIRMATVTMGMGMITVVMAMVLAGPLHKTNSTL